MLQEEDRGDSVLDLLLCVTDNVSALHWHGNGDIMTIGNVLP